MNNSVPALAPGSLVERKMNVLPDLIIMQIKQAVTPSEIEELRHMFREYATFLNVDLCFQGVEEELAHLPGKYAPPSGMLLMGLSLGEVAGCVALRELESGICEMKRLFVRLRFRSLGLGRQLTAAILAEARGLGYYLMRLDTLNHLTGAIRLYEQLGLHPIGPYYENPLPGVTYWELDLTARQHGIANS